MRLNLPTISSKILKHANAHEMKSARACVELCHLHASQRTRTSGTDALATWRDVERSQTHPVAVDVSVSLKGDPAVHVLDMKMSGPAGMGNGAATPQSRSRGDPPRETLRTHPLPLALRLYPCISVASTAINSQLSQGNYINLLVQWDI